MRLANAIGNGSRVTGQDHGCVRSTGRCSYCDVGVRLARFQQARIHQPLGASANSHTSNTMNAVLRLARVLEKSFMLVEV